MILDFLDNCSFWHFSTPNMFDNKLFLFSQDLVFTYNKKYKLRGNLAVILTSHFTNEETKARWIMWLDFFNIKKINVYLFGSKSLCFYL